MVKIQRTAEKEDNYDFEGDNWLQEPKEPKDVKSEVNILLFDPLKTLLTYL